ncbi:uncharacterized protein FRV6_14225 [Fusarium oxysporum]|uniref:HNH nuclease domain-containing protein n=1 Tax=Fusarium oxysporum TaxID=5507 RepID=A0A2H3TNE7_FUSOX|nr:uncharacterized protein FRV6_14225 [Fusarium oxysporum]
MKMSIATMIEEENEDDHGPGEEYINKCGQVETETYCNESNEYCDANSNEDVSSKTLLYRLQKSPFRGTPVTNSGYWNMETCHKYLDASVELIKSAFAVVYFKPPLGPGLCLSASRRFYQIVNHFDASGSGNNGEYDRIKLVCLTYEYARSEESKGNFLSAFFQSAALPMDGEEAIDLGDADLEAELRTSLFNFAEYLFDNFFLPLKASTKKTPQPSPATHSAVQRT